MGAVIKDFISLSSLFDIEHNLFCLDKSETNFGDMPVNGIKLESLSSQSNIFFTELLHDSDVILIHYWNHPLLAKFLASTALPACRLLVWCHNSGLQEPHIIPQYLVRMANKVVFTSNCSVNAPNLQTDIKSQSARFGVIHSTHDLNPFYEVGLTRVPSEQLNKLLYVGTVSKSKMHSDSASMLASLSKSGFKICVAGGPDHLALQHEVLSLGGEIEIVGFTKSLLPFYKNADFFIYPLRSDHYGTGEQVMLEAMAAGLPIIAFNNPAELEIVSSGKTGILVSSCDDFINTIKNVSVDKNVYQGMSTEAIKRVSRQFDANVMAEKLLAHVKNVMDIAKVVPARPIENNSVSLNMFDIFVLNSFFDETLLISLHKAKCERVIQIFSKIKGQLNNANAASVWTAKTKSSPFHYLNYFPANEELRYLTEMINNEVSNINLV